MATQKEKKAPQKKEKKPRRADPKIKGIPEELKHKRGPKPLYSDPTILQAKIDEYLATTGYQIATLPDGSIARDAKGNAVWRRVTPTMAGFAHYLGFCDRESPMKIVARAKQDGASEAEKEMSRIVTRARLQIESYWEGELTTPGCANGVKLWLTNHGGYHDRQEVEHSGGVIPADLSKLSPDERDALLKAVEKA
jgi:hypothetical protein